MDLQALEPLLRSALAEDVGTGDVTTRLLVPADAAGHGVIVAKQRGVLAGIDVALAVLRLAGGEEPRVLERAEEGAAIEPGDLVLDLEGSAQALLSGERTALNFLMRMSGIASLTAKYVEAVRGTEARILDTRKTTPGLRVLERHAVRAGGGENHRFALYDAILVKENHLAFGGDLASALASRPEGMPAIVEAESVEEFHVAMEAGADVVLLDEFSPEEVARARTERGERTRPLLEVSGGIALQNVRAYAEAGAERISVGALTHSPPALDLSMRVVPIT